MLRVVVALLALATAALPEDGSHLLRVDHYVRVKSIVPAIAGQTSLIYVREVVRAGTALRGPVTDRVLLFVHGAGTPAEVSFDLGYKDHSWMAYLADAGFDVFSMDMTGYGPSTRPAAMNDPCNLSTQQQAAFVPTLIPAPCAPPYPHPMTTIASDWNDLDAVVDQIRVLRHVDRVSLLGWSMGGPRAGGYALAHPEKISKLVLLAPAYSRNAPSGPPAQLPADGIAYNTQSEAEFMANWDRQVGCAEQYDPAAATAVWREMMQSDPVGATWGTGVRRAPQLTSWGWNAVTVAKLRIPTLLVSGAYDKQVDPGRVRELFADLGATQKVFIDLGCSSHMAMWERNRRELYKASLEWLTKGTVEGKQEGLLKLGY